MLEPKCASTGGVVFMEKMRNRRTRVFAPPPPSEQPKLCGPGDRATATFFDLINGDGSPFLWASAGCERRCEVAVGRPEKKVYAARLRNFFAELACVRFWTETKFKVITTDMFGWLEGTPFRRTLT